MEQIQSLKIETSENRDEKEAFNSKRPYLAKMIENKRLTAPEWSQDVRHIVFELPFDQNESLQYHPGDALAIVPSNSREITLEFLQFMNIDPSLIVWEMKKREDESSRQSIKNDDDTIMADITKIKSPISVIELFQNYIDFQSCPKQRRFFEQLQHFTTASHEKERLEYFASSEGAQDLRWYCYQEKRSYFQVFQDFPFCKPSLDYLLDMIPLIQPRLFSISSSMAVHPQQVHLTVAVVRFKTPMKRIATGLCTNWLSETDPHSHSSPSAPSQLSPDILSSSLARVWIRRSSTLFKLPADPSVPLILVGPGTGVAPFRAFIEQRHYECKVLGQEVGEIVLFFGCRHREKDELYGSEWRSYAEEGTLSAYHCAFSRDQGQKIYVQQMIAQQSALIFPLLTQKRAHIFVCGSSGNMPRDVRLAFISTLEKEGPMDTKAATSLVQTMERTGRYNTETWS